MAAATVIDRHQGITSEGILEANIVIATTAATGRHKKIKTRWILYASAELA